MIGNKRLQYIFLLVSLQQRFFALVLFQSYKKVIPLLMKFRKECAGYERISEQHSSNLPDLQTSDR